MIDILLFVVAGLAALIGAILLVTAIDERADVIRYVELYSAISTLIAAVLFGGFGSVISLLKQIALKTNPAPADTASVAPGLSSQPSSGSSVVQTGIYEGYPWRELSTNVVQAKMDGGVSNFKNVAEFQQYVRLKGPAAT